MHEYQIQNPTFIFETKWTFYTSRTWFKYTALLKLIRYLEIKTKFNINEFVLSAKLIVVTVSLNGRIVFTVDTNVLFQLVRINRKTIHTRKLKAILCQFISDLQFILKVRHYSSEGSLTGYTILADPDTYNDCTRHVIVELNHNLNVLKCPEL